MKTSLEWFIEHLTAMDLLKIPDGSNAITFIIQEMKEMEKQQIIDAHNSGKSILPPNESGEQYYKETFKK